MELEEGTTQPRLSLYPYQAKGAAFLSAARSALLADEMGVGKTVQAIAVMEQDDLYPALIVCPNSVKRVWLTEFERWAPRRRVIVAANGTRAAEEAAEEVANGIGDVLVVNWEALKSLTKLAGFGSIRLEGCTNCDPNSTNKPNRCQREDKILNTVRWAVVVADEAHRAKDPKSQQTRALWAIGSSAERRYALTGTPIANSAEDLWSVMRFVAPEEYPSKWQWLDRYAEQTPNMFSGGVDVQGLRKDRRDELDQFFLPRFLRRTKKEVLPDLPPKVYVRRDVTLAGKQKKAYDQLEREMIAQLDGGDVTATNALTGMLRLRQLASAYGQVTSTIEWKGSMDDPQALNESIEKQVTLAEPSSKLDELDLVLDELGDRQAVIFAESRQLLELAEARFTRDERTFGKVTGDVKPDQRAEYIERFQRGELQYMLVTTAAGGEGITLTAADTAIFLQRPWSAVQNAQAEDRLHRIGQEASSVTYIDLVTTDTVEEKVFEALNRKAQVLQTVTEDEDSE